MLKTLLVLGLSATAFAADAFPVFNKRQTVPIPCNQSGRKDCGDGCIPLTYACCPDQQGGCPLTSICWLGSNGAYGCCPIGQRCSGPGGVNTQPGSTLTSTIFSTETVPDEETSTSFLVPATTSTIALTSEPEPESSTASTSLAPQTTSLSSTPPVVTASTKTTTFVAPTTEPNSTTTRAPPVTVNGAKTLGASLLQGVAVAVMAFFAI